MGLVQRWSLHFCFGLQVRPLPQLNQLTHRNHLRRRNEIAPSESRQRIEPVGLCIGGRVSIFDGRRRAGCNHRAIDHDVPRRYRYGSASPAGLTIGCPPATLIDGPVTHWNRELGGLLEIG